MTNQVDSKIRDERKKQTAEVFTPPELVNEILDKLPLEVWESNKTFCDPAAGNGNIVIEVIKRKLLNNHEPIEIVQTVYAVELMEDNVREMKSRIYSLFDESEHSILKPFIDKNIVCYDTLQWDFEKWKGKIKYHSLNI